MIGQVSCYSLEMSLTKDTDRKDYRKIGPSVLKLKDFSFFTILYPLAIFAQDVVLMSDNSSKL